MGFIIFGYKSGIRNAKFLGMKVCGSCGHFSEFYLARSYVHTRLFFFIPLFGFPTGRYIKCDACNGVKKLKRDEWKQYKNECSDMPKTKNYRKAFTELKALVDGVDPSTYDEENIYNQLMGKLDFADSGFHIRKLVTDYCAFRRIIAEQKAAKLAAEQAAEQAALTGAEQPQQTENAAEAPAAAALPEKSAAPAPAPAAPAPAPAVTATETKAVAVDESEAAVSKKGILVPRSKKRLLWLIPALILLIPAIIFVITSITAFAECFAPALSADDRIVNAFSAVITAIPAALDVLFFVLALKKNKRVK